MSVDEHPAAEKTGSLSHASTALRCLVALALVWAASVLCYQVRLSVVVAAVAVVATVVVVPIGTTLVDRLVGLFLLVAAPAVLVAWVTPMV
ncbi:MAG: hypothetical protein WCI74_21145, partial [Actinomycetes bacterium]